MGAPETNHDDELHAATTNWMLPLWLCTFALRSKPMLLTQLVAVDGVVVAVPGKPFNSLIHSHIHWTEWNPLDVNLLVIEEDSLIFILLQSRRGAVLVSFMAHGLLVSNS